MDIETGDNRNLIYWLVQALGGGNFTIYELSSKPPLFLDKFEILLHF